MDSQQPNIKEFLHARQLTLWGVVRIVADASERRDVLGALRMGLASETTFGRMVFALRCTEAELRAALTESQARPGQRDTRGRKPRKPLGGGTHGKSIEDGLGSARHGALAAHV